MKVFLAKHFIQKSAFLDSDIHIPSSQTTQISTYRQVKQLRYPHTVKSNTVVFSSFSITDATNVRLGIEPTFIITIANATG